MKPLSKDLVDQILACTGACGIRDTQPVQTLWSGYGQIVRVNLILEDYHRHDGDTSLIVKDVQPPETLNHPRGWNTDASTQRKLESYRVEANWYRQYVESARSLCAMPRLLGSYSSVEQTSLILEDLDRDYPQRHDRLSVESCKPCIRWLARFHGYHFQSSGEGLWHTGTYWYLKTRRDEWTAMAPGALKDAASALDARLENCQFKTLVHGDAKVANVCFSQSGRDVAMVDFQYVGRGCGIRDVAYFLGSALTETECENHGEELLDVYFSELSSYIPEMLQQPVEKEWRDLYATAWADFHRFLAGWMPGHTKIHGYTRAMTRKALAELALRTH
ncbi:MAG: phosphotransferase [Granulosicoccus sp.]